MKPANVWCADLMVPVNPCGDQQAATPETPAVMQRNALWSADERTVRLAGAANEVVAFQVVVEKSAGTIQDLRIEGDASITCAWFQNIAVPVRGEYRDDPLVPLAASPCGASIAAINRRAPRFDGRRRQTFTLELHIPKGAQPGRRDLKLTVQASRGETQLAVSLTIYAFELADEPACVADINNYSRSPGNGYDLAPDDFDGFLAIEREHFRMARQHRALFHLLPYSQSGRQEKSFAPILAGRGRTRRIIDWTDFDRHWGPYLDGSAFRDLPGGARPIEYLYTPVNCNWPALFEKYGTPGYWFEYRKVLGEMAAHFAERGWTRTRLEVFFNHKSRWKFFPWDMDEIRFDRDNQTTIDFGRHALEATAGQPQVQIVNRIDSSWIFPQSAMTEMDKLIGLWVVNNHCHAAAPEAVAHLRACGQKVWFYGGAAPIAAPDRSDNLRWPWIAWGRETDGFCWWNGLSWGKWESVDLGGNHCFYPGARFGIRGPLASIRLKALHRGMQDHAYLTLLTARAGRPAVDAILAAPLGAQSRLDWYAAKNPQSSLGGADIESTFAAPKLWSKAGWQTFQQTREILALAIEKQKGT